MNLSENYGYYEQEVSFQTRCLLFRGLSDVLDIIFYYSPVSFVSRTLQTWHDWYNALNQIPIPNLNCCKRSIIDREGLQESHWSIWKPLLAQTKPFYQTNRPALERHKCAFVPEIIVYDMIVAATTHQATDTGQWRHATPWWDWCCGSTACATHEWLGLHSRGSSIAKTPA